MEPTLPYHLPTYARFPMNEDGRNPLLENAVRNEANAINWHPYRTSTAQANEPYENFAARKFFQDNMTGFMSTVETRRMLQNDIEAHRETMNPNNILDIQEERTINAAIRNNDRTEDTKIREAARALGSVFNKPVMGANQTFSSYIAQRNLADPYDYAREQRRLVNENSEARTILRHLLPRDIVNEVFKYMVPHIPRHRFREVDDA